MPYFPPAASGGGGSVVFQDEGSAVGTATILNFVGAGVTATHSGGTVTATIAGGTAAGADDPIADVFGAADTAFEFGSSSLAGLTALGTPDAENAHTTIPGHYYVADNASGIAWVGRYVAATPPFTAITLLADANPKDDYNSVGIFVCEATPGVLVSIGPTRADRTIRTEKFSNPTTFSAQLTAGQVSAEMPLYLAVVVNSTTDIDYLYSWGGRIWRKLTDANNPSATIAAVGIGMKSENATTTAAAFGFLRIWNSAKTFPGVV